MHRIKVWRITANKWSHEPNRMWYGECTCNETWQFWFWGATLGYGLQHIWKEAHVQ